MGFYIRIDIKHQTLTLHHKSQHGCSPQADALKIYSISTGKNGVGNLQGTGCTPLGQHVISDKLGADQPANAVFVGRVPTGEIYDKQLDKQHPNRDWILSRIMWLSGCEPGINQGENEQGHCCDTHARYIYIHGTPDTEPMGVAMSHGCIRMRNTDIIELFERVEEGTMVDIVN